MSKNESNKETPVEETPVEETPVEETPVEETPVEETPVEETPVVNIQDMIRNGKSSEAELFLIGKGKSQAAAQKAIFNIASRM